MANNENDILSNVRNFAYNNTNRKILEAIRLGKRQLIELEHCTGASRPTIREHINELVNDGFITYESSFNKKTGRHAGAQLTDAGEIEVNRLNSEYQHIQGVTIDAITPIPIFNPQAQNGVWLSGTQHAESSKPISEEQRQAIVSWSEKTAADFFKRFPNITSSNMRLLAMRKKK